MKKVLFMPVLAAVLFAAGCKDEGPPEPSANVRFFNATTGMTGSGGFTTNGQFASGSALASGKSTQTCSKVTVGSTAFGFGAANTGGTALNGSALATLANQSVIDGGNYTVVATGSATSPMLFMFDNTFSGSLGSNQAAIRFVNLAPGSGATANLFVVLAGSFDDGGQTTLVQSNMAAGELTSFSTVASGSRTYSLLRQPGHNIVSPGTALNLQGGSVNTVAIVEDASGGFQFINIPRC